VLIVFPCQVVFTGAAHLLLPIRDRRLWIEFKPDAPALYALLPKSGRGAVMCSVWTLDSRRLPALRPFFNPTRGNLGGSGYRYGGGTLSAHRLPRMARPAIDSDRAGPHGPDGLIDFQFTAIP